MASIQKTERGYRAQVAIRGVRESSTFRTKREAEAWASSRESALREQAKKAPAERHTLGELLIRYRDEVSITKRGERWEIIRINRFLTASPDLAKKLLADLAPEDFAAWRDARLREVSAGSVIREIGQIAAALEMARREWRWIDHNPLSDVRKPPQPRHREVVISGKQIRAMLRALGYSPGRRPAEQRHMVALCFLVALRTGMRAGELCGLTWDRVARDHVVLLVTKTVPRRVPLSRRAVMLLERARGWDERLVFGLRVETLDALFRKYRARAGLAGFTFHDARHTAATWMARKVDVLDLCKIMGWSNTKQALTYYNPSASDLAARLD
ncbi:MAG: site-specific integrase [Candidatus Dactylopiibacterium sp.]|nr:site-specific integrase [Candidatus Dactylopiibacterium sp.]